MIRSMGHCWNRKSIFSESIQCTLKQCNVLCTTLSRIVTLWIDLPFWADFDHFEANNFFCVKTPWGQFHQTLFAKQKDAGAQRSAKNSPFNFTNHCLFNPARDTKLKSVRRSPNLCAKNSFSFCSRAKVGRKCWWNRPQVVRVAVGWKLELT